MEREKGQKGRGSERGEGKGENMEKGRMERVDETEKMGRRGGTGREKGK